MKKICKIFSGLTALVMIAVLFMACSQFNAGGKVNAECGTESFVDNDEALTRGIFVNVTLSMNGGNYQVWTTAAHEFSLFSTTVKIYVYLYYSTTFTDDYHNMTLADYAYSSNLLRGDSLTVTVSTGNEQRYWIGRMHYKVDDRDWADSVVGPILYSASGTELSI